MKFHPSVIIAAMTLALASCSGTEKTQNQADFEPIPFNEPTNLSLAVVDDNAAYNYFTRDSWGALAPEVKATYIPVGVCLFTETDSMIVMLRDLDSKTALISDIAPVNDMPRYDSKEKALADTDGLTDCNAMLAEPCNPVAIKAVHDIEIANLDANMLYVPALGQMQAIAANKSKLNDAIKAFGGDHVKNARYWSSTQGMVQQDKATFWVYGVKDDYTGIATGGNAAYVRPVMDVQR